MLRAQLIPCAILGALLIGACSKDKSEPVSTTEMTSAEYRTSFLEPQPSLTRNAEVAIASDSMLSLQAKNVDVSVEGGGQATLRGSVFDPSVKKDVERTVAAVPGVTSVRNEIDVSLVRDADDGESDERIAFELQRSLASSPALGADADRVTIEVVHGQVKLRGALTQPDSKGALIHIAETTPGVRSISDNTTYQR